ncbi:DNA-binding transcriptional MerR regulator [Clostridiales Family XIII bacterium PM5-7]
MKEYYKIGEISNLYNIGTDSLRYYEELGILSPKRDANGYRMYGIGDIRTLNILRELRSVGFSIAEIKTFLQDFNVEKTIALFEAEIEAINEKRHELFVLKKQLEIRIDGIKKNISMEMPAEKAEVVSIGSRKIIALNDNVYRDADIDFVIKKLQKKTENQLYIIGNSHMGATIPLDYIRSGEYGHFTSVFNVVDDDSEEYDDLIPEGDYLCRTVRGSYALMPQAWEQFFHDSDLMGLTPDGDPMEFYIIDNHDTNDEEEQVTILQMKIK